VDSAKPPRQAVAMRERSQSAAEEFRRTYDRMVARDLIPDVLQVVGNRLTV
jgi:hypothetical protein